MSPIDHSIFLLRCLYPNALFFDYNLDTATLEAALSAVLATLPVLAGRWEVFSKAAAARRIFSLIYCFFETFLHVATLSAADCHQQRNCRSVPLFLTFLLCSLQRL